MRKYKLTSDDVYYIANWQVNRTNPTVELWFSDFDGPMGTKRVAPPESLTRDGGEAHFSRVTWPSDRHFAVQWMNRFQTKTVLTLCDTRVSQKILPLLFSIFCQVKIVNTT